MFTDRHLQAFDAVVRQLKVPAWLCGGTVRDLLLDRPIHDVDVVLPDRVFDAARLLASRLEAASFILDRERHVARVVFGKGNWDLTGFRDQTIEGDLRKRDFTINAMAIRWEDYFPSRSLAQVLDPFHGTADLRDRLIRTVTSESLTEDPLRMLRAFRIQAELGFAIEASALEQIEQVHDTIAGIAGERVRDELDRILLRADSASAWRSLGATRLFDSLFPEMKGMKGCEQGGYHHLDVWEHSVAALEHVEKLLVTLGDLFPDHAAGLMQYLTSSPGTLHRTTLLKWAAVLHDIGKPRTRELREPGRWRFPGHDHAGADLAAELMTRLRFSRKDIQIIMSIIEHHLRPLNLFNQPQRDEDSFYKLFRASGPEALGVLLLAVGDLAAARGPIADPSRDADFIQLIRQLLDYYYREYYPAISTPELLKGRDLMGFLQMKPGPQMGELLKDMREAQLTGRLHTREDAMQFAREWLKNKD